MLDCASVMWLPVRYSLPRATNGLVRPAPRCANRAGQGSRALRSGRDEVAPARETTADRGGAINARGGDDLFGWVVEALVRREQLAGAGEGIAPSR